MTYPEELVELADSLRRMGVIEFRYGAEGAHVRFSPAAATLNTDPPESSEPKRTAREQGKELPLPEGKELPLPENFDGIDIEGLLG